MGQDLAPGTLHYMITAMVVTTRRTFRDYYTVEFKEGQFTIVDIKYIEEHARYTNFFALGHRERYCTLRLRRPVIQARRAPTEETQRWLPPNREDNRCHNDVNDGNTQRQLEKRTESKGKKPTSKDSKQSKTKKFDYKTFLKEKEVEWHAQAEAHKLRTERHGASSHYKKGGPSRIPNMPVAPEELKELIEAVDNSANTKAAGGEENAKEGVGIHIEYTVEIKRL